MKPPARFKETVIKWLRGDPSDEQMEYSDSLSEHFPEGPALQTEKKIDVIIATDACTTLSSRPLVAIFIHGPDFDIPQFSTN